MKLLFINNIPLPLPPVKGGAVEYLIDEFLKHNEKIQKYEITVFSMYNKMAEIQAKNYKKTEFKYIKIKTVFDKIDRAIRHIINKYLHVYVGNTYICKVIKSIRDFNDYDIIIIENAPEFALKIPKHYKNKLVLHLHNDRLKSTTRNNKKLFDLYDEIYTISNTLGDYVQTIKKSSKVKTLYNGIDLNKFVVQDDLKFKIREKYNIKPTDFVFMYSGRIVADKGVYELAVAFSKLKGEDYKLIIVGGTGYDEYGESNYLKKIKAINDKRIIFTGFVPYDQMPKMYMLANVGVVPSICRDAFNLTVIEFLANGIPVIISDRGAMNELVEDSCSIEVKYDENFINNIYDALISSKNKFKNHQAISKVCLKISKNFSIAKYCNRFEDLLDSIGVLNEY